MNAKIVAHIVPLGVLSEYSAALMDENCSCVCVQRPVVIEEGRVED